MQDDQWVDIMQNTMAAIHDDIPYVWDHFTQRFKEHFTRQHRQTELSDQLAKLQMHNQKLEAYIDHFEKLTNELMSPHDNTFFLALFIQGLTNQLRDTVRLHEVQNYKGLQRQVEENLLDMQHKTEYKHAMI